MDIFDLPIKHKDTKTVVKTALGAAKIILKVYNENFVTEYKPGDEPVTQADKLSDAYIIESLKSAFPNDRILTEEHGLYTPQKDVSNRLWIIDPVDGTQEFVNKTGDFATQIALAVNGKLELGAVYQPTTSTLYIASKDEGCWKFSEAGWQKLHVPQCDYDNLTLMISRNHKCPTGESIHKALGGKNIKAHGGVGLKLMMIAEQKAHYYINNSNKTKAWDSAAPEILFKEAGGVITDLQGNPFSYDPADYKHKHGLVASCSEDLHKKVVQLAKEMEKQ